MKLKELEEKYLALGKEIEALKKKDKFEVGKWYKSNKIHERLFVWNEGNLTYGFHEGKWGSDWVFHEEYYKRFNFTPATEEEVEQALIKEAKRRGFKEGVTINRAHFPDYSHNDTCVIGRQDFSFNNYESDKYALALGGRIIFHNGFWAEIIEDKLTINGYEMQVDGDIVSFGCAKFTKKQLIETYRFTESFLAVKPSNRKIKSIKLDSEVELSIEDLEKIVKKLS